MAWGYFGADLDTAGAIQLYKTGSGGVTNLDTYGTGDTSFTNFSPRASVVNMGDKLYCLSPSGIYTSTDGGTTVTLAHSFTIPATDSRLDGMTGIYPFLDNDGTTYIVGAYLKTSGNGSVIYRINTSTGAYSETALAGTDIREAKPAIDERAIGNKIYMAYHVVGGIFQNRITIGYINMENQTYTKINTYPTRMAAGNDPNTGCFYPLGTTVHFAPIGSSQSCGCECSEDQVGIVSVGASSVNWVAQITGIGTGVAPAWGGSAVFVTNAGHYMTLYDQPGGHWSLYRLIANGSLSIAEVGSPAWSTAQGTGGRYTVQYDYDTSLTDPDPIISTNQNTGGDKIYRWVNASTVMTELASYHTLHNVATQYDFGKASRETILASVTGEGSGAGGTAVNVIADGDPGVADKTIKLYYKARGTDNSNAVQCTLLSVTPSGSISGGNSATGIDADGTEYTIVWDHSTDGLGDGVDRVFFATIE
jgi:hypothetical protein